MRFRRWAAAAAAMMLAGQASAARYVELQIKGAATIPTYVGTPGNGGQLRDFSYADVISLTLDIAQVQAATNYLLIYGGQNTNTSSYFLVATYTDDGVRLNSFVERGGPSFFFTFQPSALNVGDPPAEVAANLTNYSYQLCSAKACNSPAPGILVSVYARATDVAPASLQFTESTSATLLPEPATWAIMILGMAAIGVVFRRRRGTNTAPVASRFA